MPHHHTRGISLATAAILLTPAFSQTTTTSSAPTTGTSTTSTTTTTSPTRTSPLPSISTTPTTGTTTTAPPTRPAPILVTGRVLLEDGTPPPNSAVIERLCGGATHSEGYTDPKGYFSVELGQNAAALEDASESGFNRSIAGSGGSSGTGSTTNSFGSTRLGSDSRFSACELRARLGGFRSQSISLFNRGPMDNPDVGVILLHRLGEQDAATVTASSLTAPKGARKAYTKGLDLVKKKKPEEAMASFQEAVAADAKFASAWYELGRLQLASGAGAEAHQSFETAVAAEPRLLEPYLQLSLMAVRDHHWQEAADMTDKALRLNSFDYPQAFFFNAVAHYNLRHVDMAEKSVRAAIRLDTRHEIPQSAHLLGTILLERRQYAEAADQLRSYLVQAPGAVDVVAVRKQLDDVEKLAYQAPIVALREQEQK